MQEDTRDIKEKGINLNYLNKINAKVGRGKIE